jgi:hypothetical protein
MSDKRAAARASAPKDEPPATPEVPIAYALIEEAPGKWSAVLLEGVTAREMTRLEVNGQPEPQARAMMRAISAIERRTIAKKWSRP